MAPAKMSYWEPHNVPYAEWADYALAKHQATKPKEVKDAIPPKREQAVEAPQSEPSIA